MVTGGKEERVSELGVVVNRSSRVPLYLQVAEQLEQAITSGKLAAGSRIPNEIELADRLGLSRPTMRQAIAYLVDKGLLVRKRGVGTQVVQAKMRRPLALSSLYDDLLRAGRDPRTTVRDVATVPATIEASRALGIAPRDRVLRIRRIRYIGDEPLALMTNYLSEDVTRGADLTKESLERHGLYDLLRRAGISLRVADQTIGARPAIAREASLLRERTGAALLTMTRTAYDDQGRAIEYGSHLYRASRYSFELTLVER